MARFLSVVATLAVSSIFLAGCATPISYGGGPLSRYDRDTEYSIQQVVDGFSVTVHYSRYQFIPESQVVATQCRGQVTAIAWEHAEKLGKEIDPISEERVQVSMGRNGLTGITSCRARVSANWKTAKVGDPQTRPEGPPTASNISAGTCFAVSETEILTSHHVVMDAYSVTVKFADGVETSSVISKQSQAADLALLKIKGRTPAFLPLAPARSSEIGERVFTVGFPATAILGDDPKFTEGSISSLTGIQGDSGYLQMSIPVQPGSSGGPVVNHRGEVVGIVAATAAIEAFYSNTGALPQNVNWASKSENARLLFDPPETVSTALSREDAIDRVQAALCKVTATAD